MYQEDPPSLSKPLLGENQVKADNKAKREQISRDFRSDTLTIPTEEMIAAMAEATMGDDVYGEDEVTNSFQREIAALTGKEAALFVVTGTLSNQLALRTHLHQPPYAIVCDTRSHIHRYEAGGIAFHSGAATELTIPSNGHHIRLEEDIIPNLCLSDDIHFAPTRIISLENTLNGTIFPQDEIVKISDYAREKGIKMHLDGARLWNVAAETGLSLKELCQPFDTVSLCLSKGLGAPIGSILVGPREFIAKARHFRKLFGAGTRQTGSLAAAARVAVQSNFPKLRRTHELAKMAGEELQKLGVRLTCPVETCMVWMDTSSVGIQVKQLVERAAALPRPVKLGGERMVIHHQIDKQAVVDVINLVKTLIEEKKKEEEEQRSRGQDENQNRTNGSKGEKISSASALAATAAATAAGGSSSEEDAQEKKGTEATFSNMKNGVDVASDGSFRHYVNLTLPFPSRSSAEKVQKVIQVDKELRPHDVSKSFTIQEEKGSGGKVDLKVKISATTIRHLRLSTNAFLEDAALVTRTMAAFGGPREVKGGYEAEWVGPAASQPLSAARSELEQGSVGLAG
ncbi:hypothetical protein IE53DRAFT_319342 [Violaceomyces palustris]|uniref:Uncharacterized protein n=1 Tax=Violaceomyces palustris TaxID=1673888 RepID=A0ACD0NRP8_9BASI|nr:hypothetical protein IE53DRAFT_319342 [Violaceomyces palustris]